MCLVVERQLLTNGPKMEIGVVIPGIHGLEFNISTMRLVHNLEK